VGKSSIINELRLVAMDPAQRNRLARFEKAMATEYDWRLADDANVEDEQSRMRCDSAITGPAVAMGVDCSAADLSSSSFQGSGDRAERRQGNNGDVRGAKNCGRKPEVHDKATSQGSWQRRSDDIYGAQVCSLCMNMTGSHKRRGTLQPFTTSAMFWMERACILLKSPYLHARTGSHMFRL
jgi:hypothetical protein